MGQGRETKTSKRLHQPDRLPVVSVPRHEVCLVGGISVRVDGDDAPRSSPGLCSLRATITIAPKEATLATLVLSPRDQTWRCAPPPPFARLRTRPGATGGEPAIRAAYSPTHAFSARKHLQRSATLGRTHAGYRAHNRPAESQPKRCHNQHLTTRRSIHPSMCLPSASTTIHLMHFDTYILLPFAHVPRF